MMNVLIIELGNGIDNIKSSDEPDVIYIAKQYANMPSVDVDEVFKILHEKWSGIPIHVADIKAWRYR